jgi:hypothetical protein
MVRGRPYVVLRKVNTSCQVRAQHSAGNFLANQERNILFAWYSYWHWQEGAMSQAAALSSESAASR